MSDQVSDAPPPVRALLGERDFMLQWSSRWLCTLASQIQSVALGWQIYALARRTHSVEESAFWVGMVGLATFVPVLLLTLPAGESADRYARKKVMLIALSVEMVSVAILAVATWRGVATIPLLLAVAALFGAARAFFNPAGTALAPMLVPRALLPRAIAWTSLSWQSSAVAGPALGGLLVSISTAHAYFTVLAFYAVGWLALLAIARNTKPDAQPGSRWALMKEGLAYVWREKIVFGAISLDLAAVLLGGATALLPVFAQDVLHVGAEGFGLLRAAPAIGATLVGVVLASWPPRRHAGVLMFGGVALFGLGSLVFGLSKTMWLSVVSLAVLGGADMASVYVRQTLVQLVTPDPMRGRVAAVSSVFIGASNELGEFESGLVARFLGPVGAAVFGGIGAIAVTGLWARLFPALRKADKLN